MKITFIPEICVVMYMIFLTKHEFTKINYKNILINVTFLLTTFITLFPLERVAIPRNLLVFIHY